MGLCQGMAVPKNTNGTVKFKRFPRCISHGQTQRRNLVRSRQEPGGPGGAARVSGRPAPATRSCAQESRRCWGRSGGGDFFKDAGRVKAQLPAVSTEPGENPEFPRGRRPQPEFPFTEGPGPASAITNCSRKSAKAAAAWFIWPSRRSRSAAGWRSRSSSWAWTPRASSPGSRPSGRRWR